MFSNWYEFGYEQLDDKCLVRPNSYTTVNVISLSQNKQESTQKEKEEKYIHNFNANEDEQYIKDIHHFESSFRHKLDSELHTFQRNIHNFLSEQQTHIQKIYTSAEFPVILLDQSMNPAGQESPGFEENSNNLYTCCTDEEFSCETKASLMIELLSLSCQLTALLNLPKFSLTET